MIIADVHEPEDLKEIADEVKELPVDYFVIGNERKYAVERKEVMDLWKSVTDGRLWRQMTYLESTRDEGYIPILLIEGNLSKLFVFVKGMTPKKYMGLQLAFSSFGVSVVQLHPKYTKMFLQFLNEKSGKKRSHPRYVIPKPIERSLGEEMVDVLCAVRGIGPKTAEKLLERFGSIYGCITAEESDLEKILGKKTGHFLEVFRGSYVASKNKEEVIEDA